MFACVQSPQPPQRLGMPSQQAAGSHTNFRLSALAIELRFIPSAANRAASIFQYTESRAQRHQRWMPALQWRRRRRLLGSWSGWLRASCCPQVRVNLAQAAQPVSNQVVLGPAAAAAACTSGERAECSTRLAPSCPLTTAAPPAACSRCPVLLHRLALRRV